MPLTLTFTEDALPKGSASEAISKITNSMLKWHGLEGNRVMTPMVTASVHVLPKGSTFSGGKEVSGVWVEWKTPSFAFNSPEIQQGFFDDTTNIIHDLSGGKQPKENIYINVVHAVDGAWSLDGQAVTNDQLGAAISGH